MVFRLVLWSVGTLLAIASRASSRLRAQLARNLTVCICSRDGVARSYVFRDRKISSHAGLAPNSHCTLIFSTAKDGARIFLATDCIAQVVDGLASKTIGIQGDPADVLWFYEMVMARVPGHPFRPCAMPDAYTTPDPEGKVTDRITREPAVDMLTPAWAQAFAQREKLILWQVGKGARVHGKSNTFKPVVDVSQSLPEKANG